VEEVRIVRIMILKKNMLMVLIAAFLSLTVVGEDAEIHVTGILVAQEQRVAIVNGKLHHVDDEVAGGRITAIGKTSITFLRDGVSKEYPVETKSPAGKSSVSEAASEAAPAKLSKKRMVVNWLVSVKDKISSRFARFKWRREKKNAVTDSSPALELPKNAEKLTLKEKMEWADKLLADQEKRTAVIVNEDLSRCASSEEFSKILERYSEELQQGTEKINQLGLPSPETSKDLSYIKWSGDHHLRTEDMVEMRGEEIKRVADRLGVKMSVSVQYN